ncbi:PEP-CTERM sorting domain-containing protein [Aureliella helgolandensis]|uniref:Ice-binding protein C-terminal domain-containing protein n=1 Tax=Aureliella helgolandensis TaxID=2527968 RepID=A0A518GFD3_9BACT|nr:PEP-CTERM sorting domain-containing protein [Aureliella helgolandensis]QDV27312.1 hypothetical protein Q31a_57000 [Aureliella helgolandensis]
MKSVCLTSLSLALALCTWLPGVASAEMIYQANFNSGSLDNTKWTTYSSVTGVNGGYLAIYDSDPAHGKSLFMDSKTLPGTANYNHATLAVNVSGYSQMSLVFDSFTFYDFNDVLGTAPFTGTKNGDGIAISTDNNNWLPIWSPASGAASMGWTPGTTVLVSDALTSNGIADGSVSTLYIRFQQYDTYQDNGQLSSDGRAWDNIALSGTSAGAAVPEPTTGVLAGLGLLSLCGVRVSRRRR